MLLGLLIGHIFDHHGRRVANTGHHPKQGCASAATTSPTAKQHHHQHSISQNRHRCYPSVSAIYVFCHRQPLSAVGRRSSKLRVIVHQYSSLPVLILCPPSSSSVIILHNPSPIIVSSPYVSIVPPHPLPLMFSHLAAPSITNRSPLP